MERFFKSPFRFYLSISLLFLIPIISFVTRYHNPSDNDFEAFYLCATRWLNSQSVYQSQDAFPFKYPPLTILFFFPLSFFSQAPARLFLGLLNLIASLSIPFVLHRIFCTRFLPNQSYHRKTFFLATLLALMASLRFIDNEFHSKNINQLTYAFLVWGLYFARKNKKIFQFMGHFLFLFGALFKLTPLLAYIVYLKNKSWQKLWPYIILLPILIFVPHPLLWKQWLQQIHSTTGVFPISNLSIYFQGFFPIGTRYFSLNSRSLYSLVIALPFLITLFIMTLKNISLESENKNHAACTLTWVLFSLLLNPLPWQHIFGFIWVIIPIAFYFANAKEKKIVIALALFFALTPKSIVGTPISTWLEVNQFIAFAVLTLSIFNMHLVRKAIV